LAQHSAFLEAMFYGPGAGIGTTNGGTEDQLIVVQGCTSTAFANFFGWLDHKYVFEHFCI